MMTTNMTDAKYKDGTKVTISRLGFSTPGKFRGIIRGMHGDISSLQGGHPWSYIVEMVDRLPDTEYSNVVIANGCIDKDWETDD